MKIDITFYKDVSNIDNVANANQNYLSIELLLNLLAAVFIEKTRFLPNFFSDPEFGMRVYKGKIEARNEGVLFYTFWRISPRKINILKKTKLTPRELNEVNDMHIKKMSLNLTNILKSTTKMSKN